MLNSRVVFFIIVLLGVNDILILDLVIVKLQFSLEYIYIKVMVDIDLFIVMDIVQEVVFLVLRLIEVYIVFVRQNIYFNICSKLYVDNFFFLLDLFYFCL